MCTAVCALEAFRKLLLCLLQTCYLFAFSPTGLTEWRGTCLGTCVRHGIMVKFWKMELPIRSIETGWSWLFIDGGVEVRLTGRFHCLLGQRSLPRGGRLFRPHTAPCGDLVLRPGAIAGIGTADIGIVSCTLSLQLDRVCPVLVCLGGSYCAWILVSADQNCKRFEVENSNPITVAVPMAR